MKPTNINIRNVISSVKLCLAIPVALLAGKWRRNVWIITERPAQARDNGYCFFKYLRQEQKECEVYYVIDKNSGDYQKIKPYGNIIQFDSWRHYFYYCLSKIHISAHVNGCCPNDAVAFSRRMKHLIGFKDVLIPHGVSYGVAEFCLKKYTKIDLFLCSGKAEYENVLQNYGYDETEVAYTGFPRLDDWHHIKINQKQIVLMPTWRVYLAQNPDIVFENTKYFRAYQELLMDKELAKFLLDNEVRLIFYLHDNMRRYVDSFQCECPNIEVVYQDDRYDIQELLKTSALLITDYSSVHFDFAYMKKPVVYYQFDREEFFKKQYQPGNFNDRKDGFGPVVYEKAQLIRELKQAWKDGFQMSEKYYHRMRAFYQIYDERNCERVYGEIRKIR